MQIMGTPQLARILHPFVGVIMFASFIIMFFRYWHHNLINRDDIFWAKNIRKIVVNEEVGDTGRYNFGQKCVFWAAIILLVLLLASGVIIWRPYFAPAFSIPVIRFALMLHSFAAAANCGYHGAYLRRLVKGTITAMVEGWVTKTWAKKHHPRWYREVKEKQPSTSKDCIISTRAFLTNECQRSDRA
jgi:formate dehydrogenase subunit gamma